MTRSRLVATVLATLVALGLAAALGALYFDPARAAVGPLEREALVLPADARFVMGFDVRRLVASPFYARFGKGEGRIKPRTFLHLKERIGLDPERDVARVVMAGSGSGPRDGGVALVTGRFEVYKLSRAVEERPGVTMKKHEGVVEYLFREGSPSSGAFAFLDDETIAIGSQAAVEATIGNKVKGRPALRSNEALMGLLQQVKPGATFWMVGDETLLSRMPEDVPVPGGGGSMRLPPVKSLIVTGDLDPALSFEAALEAADETAAGQLADLVRGAVALAQLQAGTRPELGQLASAFSVATEGRRVLVTARLPYEMLDALAIGRRGAVGPPPTR